MKSAPTFAILLAAALLARATDIKLPTLTIGATTYTNVTITTVTPTDIYFKHATGMGNSKIRYLDPALQQRLGYDPNTAHALERMHDADTVNYVATAASRPIARADSARDTAATPDTAAILAEPIGDNSPINKPAPDLTVEKWFSDKPSSTAGKFSIVLFFTPGSEPSRRAVADLNTLQKKHPDNLVVIGLTTDTERAMSQFTDPINFPHGTDSKATTLRAAGVNSLPAVMLVDPKNNVLYLGHPAALKDDTIEKILAQ